MEVFINGTKLTGVENVKAEVVKPERKKETFEFNKRFVKGANMRFIIESKIYDTEKSEKIISFLRTYPEILFKNTRFEHTIYNKIKTSLYKTKKNNWFTVHKNIDNNYIAIKETSDNVKKILLDINDIKNYSKYFGELEEA